MVVIVVLFVVLLSYVVSIIAETKKTYELAKTDQYKCKVDTGDYKVYEGLRFIYVLIDEKHILLDKTGKEVLRYKWLLRRIGAYICENDVQGTLFIS